MNTTATRRPKTARRRREPARDGQGLTAREKAAPTAIEDWYSRNAGEERNDGQEGAHTTGEGCL